MERSRDLLPDQHLSVLVTLILVSRVPSLETGPRQAGILGSSLSVLAFAVCQSPQCIEDEEVAGAVAQWLGALDSCGVAQW